ncbi:DUF2075 domain-containing protein [Acinetobacter sp. YH12039]|uniref:DUF2075 domain-containing protein n=1 Tax=Acinetobacter sp. YH12039 TaxID=2601047 RepID=UPI0015D2465E|nr:DUF2075 domain-containing protein [Acinetobacter sp. YH12039]
MLRSYYQGSVQQFIHTNEQEIMGALALQHEFALEDLQKNAWLKQIEILKQQLDFLDEGEIFFEFSIPRMGKRVDNILLIRNLIFVIEFKVGEKSYPQYAKTQVIDYCLDLLNFHEGSHQQKVIPLLISTQAQSCEQSWSAVSTYQDTLCCNTHNLRIVIEQALYQFAGLTQLNIKQWVESRYKPTPTIIEAAQALYQGHTVDEISRSDAGAKNLAITSKKIEQIIEDAKLTNKKTICFLTGVPGAGKTLAGLNIANQRLKTNEQEHSVFLSGNGPLVDVLREALVRNTVELAKQQTEKKTRSEAEREAKAFVQNIHHFRDHYLKSNEVPIEKVVIFDEAQRAWQKDQVSNFMKQKKGIDNFSMSEPEFIISVMDRHADWCVVVCLIGGGQEINTGEAGVSEWLSALEHKYPKWKIYFSNKILQDKVYLTDPKQQFWVQKNGKNEEDLHLAVSVRSFRSEQVSHLIQHVLDGDAKSAKETYHMMSQDYPILLCRDFNVAKQWLKRKAKGSERFGVIASSGARRLKAEGIDVKNKITPADWFLNSNTDVRSAYYLEDIATEFDVQGLEIDYSCVAWDINFYFDQDWQFQAFKGSRWQNIRQTEKQKYLLNAYRVLLTRARQGMVLYIPSVDDSDWTRPKKYYDSTYNFLKQCGFNTL